MDETLSAVPVSAGAEVIATIACDLKESPIGTRSRLLDLFHGKPVLLHTLEALQRVPAIDTIVLMASEEQHAALREVAVQLFSGRPTGDQASPVGRPLNVEIIPLIARHPFTQRRVRAARAWNLQAWRGGAGQWMVFDEDYHPAAVADAAKRFAADHVVSVAAHAALLDSDMLSALIHHHLHKNHEMRVTYTPAAPGLSALVLRADIVAEMGPANCMPMNLLGYDPNSPSFDTLIREACMQVDPALSKIPNRFLLDTDRSWEMAAKLMARGPWDCAASLALAARDLAASERFTSPRELQIELTADRSTNPPGAVPAEIRRAIASLDPAHWIRWFSTQSFADDLLLTFGGDGDPLLYRDFAAVLQAARSAGIRNIHLQTDLLELPESLLIAMDAGLIDVISTNFYGDDAATYQAVAGHDGYAAVSANLEKLIAHTKQTLIVPRLLKVRQTIPHLEAFFDRWVQRVGWAVIDGPTDRAGAVPFAAVVDMAPPKRRPCRRLGDRFVIRADGRAVACDQDIHGRLMLGHIENATLAQMWLGQSFGQLRDAHAAAQWNNMDPCMNCREWHRA
jgi:radical SAM protein with 4Fe4S-binding SPASM domain